MIETEREPVFEASYDITGVEEFGSSFQALLEGKLKIPREGFRANVILNGVIRGPGIQGTAKGVDYLYTRADGRNQLDIRVTITTKEGKNLWLAADGVSTQQPDGTFKLAENATLFSTHPEYAHFNSMQLWGEGVARGGKIEVKFYPATRT